MFKNVSFKLVKLNLLKNFAFKNPCKKDKRRSLQKVLFKRALKFEKLGRLLKAKRVYIQHIAFGLKIFLIYVCILMQKISIDLKM